MHARIYPSLGDNYRKPGILLILRLAIAAALLGAYCLAKLPDDIGVAFLAAAALVSGYDLLIGAVRDLLDQNLLRERLPAVFAVSISLAIGRGAEGVLALLLLQLAYIVRDYALYRTRKTICRVIDPDRKLLRTPEHAEAVAKGTDGTFTFFEGMAVPVDCVIRDGAGTADLSFITGNHRKIRLKKGDYLPAGSICTEGQFTAEPAAQADQALYRKLAAVLKAGYGEQTDTETRLIRVTAYFLPLALFTALAILLILPLATDIPLGESVRRAAAILVIASPCGLLFPIPLTYFAGMAAARGYGAIFENARVVDDAATVKVAVFNKLGAITDRNYQVKEIKTDKMDAATFLKVAAYAAAKSENVIARAIVNAYGEDISEELVRDFSEVLDQGVAGTVDGIRIMLGSDAFFMDTGISLPAESGDGLRISMSVNGIYAGWITLSEVIMPEISVSYFKSLAGAGVERIAMLSADTREKDRAVATELGIEEYYAECPFEEKRNCLRELKGRVEARGRLAFVGDCETDAELFSEADIGIMVNGISRGGEPPKANLLLMDIGGGVLPALLRLSRRIRHHVFTGVALAGLVKLVLILLAALGITPLWFVLLIDVCASLLVLLNCTGLLLRRGV
jgi:Cd2+/Zn2+-exporting ATPase